MQFDLPGMAGAELLQLLRDVGRPAVGPGCQLGAALHGQPDLAAAQEPSRALHEGIGRVIPEVAGLTRHDLARAGQDLLEGIAEARLPDEMDRIDVVALPPGHLLMSDPEAARL